MPTDLKPSEKTKVVYSGKELVEALTFAQQQVPPNSVLHLVRTKVYPWPKAQCLPGENKPLRPPGAFKKKSELSVKDGHVALMEYASLSAIFFHYYFLLSYLGFWLL
jgi:transcription initiation factor TFIID subunit 1